MLFRRSSTGWPTFGWESPFEELDRIKRQMDLLSDRFSRGSSRESFAGVFPLMNITEDSDNFYMRAELPGIKAADLDISVTGENLTLSGERTIAAEDARYHRRERESGKFSRVVNLPSMIDTGKVTASCTNGILTVTLPKAEAAKPKQISVKAK